MLAENKPLGFIFIAPVLFTCVAKDTEKTAKITIGNDQARADQIEKLGSNMKYVPSMISLWMKKTKLYLLLLIFSQKIFLKLHLTLRNLF